METNIIVTLKCQTKHDGTDYYHSDDKTYDLPSLDKIINKYRDKIFELNPLDIHETPEWYEDMYVYETYLISKDKYEDILNIRTELSKEPDNTNRYYYDNVVTINTDGLENWIENGKIELGESVICTDPCYDIDTWCLIRLNNVLPGTYNCYYQREINENRIATIKVVHENHDDIEITENVSGEIGVDSGQAGIFDFEYYRDQKITNEDTFYDNCCNATYFESTEPNPDYYPLIKFREDIREEFEPRLASVTPNSEKYKQLTKEMSDKIFNDYKAYKETHTHCDEPVLHNGEFTAEVVNDGMNKGYVSASGYGDGGYELYIAKNNDDKIIGIKIIFIDFSENLDDED